MVAGTALGLPFSQQDSTNVLKRLGAVWAIDAAESKVGEQYADNLGPYPGMFAKYGSVMGAQILRGGLHLPGVSGNYASTPDAAALDIAGDIDLRAEVALTNYATGAIQNLVSKLNTEGGLDGSYQFRVNTNRTLTVAWVTTTPTQVLVSSSATLPGIIENGQRCQLRVTLDVDNGSSENDVKFWYKTNGQLSDHVGWTQLGATQTSAGVTNIQNSTYGVEIGTRGLGTLNPASGVVYRGMILNGIGGTTVLDVDFSKVANFSTSFTCDTGQTVTVTSSTTGVDTNDPTFLSWTGENYLYNPAISTSDGADVPHASAINISGDIEGIFRIRVGTAATGRLFTKGFAGVYAFCCSTTGIAFIPNLGAGEIYTGGIPHGLTVGTDLWIKINRVSSTGLISYYWAADQKSVPTSWTLIGTSSAPGAGPLSTNTLAMSIHRMEAISGAGRFYRGILKDGIDGPTVLDVDFTSNVQQSSFVCSTGQTVTLSRATSGKKLAMVTRPTWLFGTDDYLEVADNALIDFGVSEDFTALVIGRMWQTPSIYTDVLIGKWQGTAPTGTKGYQTRINGAATKFQGAIGDGNAAGNFTYFFDSLTNISFGSAQIHSMIRSGDSVAQWLNTAIGFVQTTAGFDTSNAQVLKIGDGSDIEIFAAAIFRRALSVQEISQIVSYYGAS